ncbi:hypothetical protein ERJ75_000979000 [Trypanosoma vivax]|nr:hypothetical protein ERJ75_000979000 [Trypanosoma vivax]
MPGERQSATAGEAARGFSEQATALGGAPPALKPLKASENDVVTIKAQSRDPCLVALASEGNRVAKGIWTGAAWEQRMPTTRRFDEFAKKRGPGTSEGDVPLFVVSLNLAKSSAAR